MPSIALTTWQTDRLARVLEIETQCAMSAALVPPNPRLTDENLRGFVMLLSAHFQGFCRDLNTECAQALAAAAPVGMRIAVQNQCMAGRELDGANPRYATLRIDFNRFGLDLTTMLNMDPLNPPRITSLDHLIAWRNYAAHHKVIPPPTGGPFTLATVVGWRDACHGLAVELDRIMYNQLMHLTGAPPW
jgi:hypothetical protein